MKSKIPRPGDLVEVEGSHPPKIGIVVEEGRKMFMVGETVLVLTDGYVERYLRDRLKVIKSN